MSDTDTPTPPYRHRSPAPGESLVEWRLSALEARHEISDRKLDRILANQTRSDVSNAAAIERCSRHETDIKEIKEQIIPVIHQRIDSIRINPRPRRDKVTMGASVGAVILAAAGAIKAYFGGHP